MSEATVQRLFSFIEQSPTAFHAIEYMRKKLLDEGYIQLLEGTDWQLTPGKGYFVIRNGSAILAFRIPEGAPVGFQIMASHSDSPMFKIKAHPEMEAEGHYVRLNVEKYGGMLCAPWFDRPLSVAGRLIVQTAEGIQQVLCDVSRDLVMIPNLAIHMNRQANDGVKVEVQKDLLPLYGDETAKGTFLPLVAESAGVKPEDIVSSDLFVYNRMPGTVWGAHGEYMSIGRLDDLQCAFSSLEAFLAAGEGESIPVHCVFDNEEVGSGTQQGAASTFLLDTLTRICEALGLSAAQYRRMLASSMMVSADNAHAVHPNHPEKACPTNRPYMNEGIVIKYSANQKYTTDAVSAALFMQICEKAGAKVQTFVNHSDVPGGSTLGNISGTQVALHTVDIGLAQLAMHSPYETAGVKDTDTLIAAGKVFFESSVCECGYGQYVIK
ncbi:MAG: M18 family aminopeptidase [Lachnospiraceae bacterium]